jgi:hypothetical protein
MQVSWIRTVVGALRAGSTTSFLPETGAQNKKAPSVSRRGLEIRVLPDLLQYARTPRTPPKGFLVFFVRVIIDLMAAPKLA